KKIDVKKKEISELEQQIVSLNEKQIRHAEQIDQMQTELKVGQEQMLQLLTRFRARLVQLHKIKQGTLLGSIFSAKSLNTFLNRFQMVKYLLENDKELLASLKEKNRQLIQVSEELNQKHRQMQSLNEELDGKKARLDSEKASIQAMLKTLVLEKKLLVQKEKKLSGTRDELENEMVRIESNRKAGEKSFEKELAISKPAKPAVKTAPLPDSAPDGAKVMNFAWPAAIPSIHKAMPSGSEKNPALAIKFSADTEILAAGRGKVLYKGQISGLGNVIILGHERGFSTVYANIDDMWVGLGQIVEQGETIGRLFAGGDGVLHFEIRFGGRKQSPHTYLPRIDQLETN
ncbi:MAG: murein hydrolase activator EnvC family protein, partial [Candidatus Rifleibacteriota bacterium]